MKDISILKCVCKYITGGFFGISSYLLGFLNSAMANVDVTMRVQVAALLNIARKVLVTIESLSWLCPTKWQQSYYETVKAVQCVVDSLQDMRITDKELTDIADRFNAAVQSWNTIDIPGKDEPPSSII